MKSSLETEIEHCTQEIDYILYNNRLEENQSVDRIVAHYLYKYGHKEWIYIDEISGPQINDISEKALMRIAEDKLVYHHKFRIVSELRNGVRYFKTKLIDRSENILTYNEIKEEINTLRNSDMKAIAEHKKILKYDEINSVEKSACWGLNYTENKN